jgi:hypothetical protein
VRERERERKRLNFNPPHHHLANSKELDIPERMEEKETNSYARKFLKR